MDIPNPLTEQHYQQIVNGLSVIAQAEQQILLAKQAGINVDQQSAQLADNKQKLLQVKNTYFPGR